MDDAFTLLRQAVDLLPEEAVAENGQTVGNIRKVPPGSGRYASATG